MNSLRNQALAVVVSGMLAALPVLGANPSGLVGVAQGAGSVEINGQPFGGQASLFSGDEILTGSGSPLTVISSSAERFLLGPGTSASVGKDGQSTVVRLNEGTIDFRTAGYLRTELPNGISVQPAKSTTTLAQVKRLTSGVAEVAVYKGSVEVADAEESVAVTAGHTAVIGPGSNLQNGNQDQKNKKKKKLWAIFIATGLNAGIVAAILANEPTRTISAVDP